MKQFIIPFLFFINFGCNKSSSLTQRQMLDLVSEGTSMEEVMLIYGVEDTIGRSRIIGEWGYDVDSLTGETSVGKEGLSPLISVNMNDSAYLLFSHGNLILKPKLTISEVKMDTMLNRILNSTSP